MAGLKAGTILMGPGQQAETTSSMSLPIESPLRVLVADDEAIYLHAIAELLQMDGFQVDTALDAFEARARLDSHDYDVLVSDIRMPGNEDLGFIQELGTLRPDLQIILVTAHPSVDSAMRAVNLPVVAYLTKPVDLDVLTATIRRAGANLRTRQAIRLARGRLAHWVEDLDQLQAAPVRTFEGLDRDITRDVLGLAMGNIAGVLLDMKALFESSLGPGAPSITCEIKSCPRLEAYRKAVGEGIEVLEQTRHAFKSKELGRLRQRLEELQNT
jgi:CheY-like chemotaxis protein